jgi:hypothetical protein
MGQEILSVAIWTPIPGMEDAAFDTMREITSIVTRKAYARDLVYRDDHSNYVLLRYWKSEAARREAQEDPAMLRCWARLSNEIEIVKVYESLVEIHSSEIHSRESRLTEDK